MENTPERPTPKAEVRVFPTWFLIAIALGWLLLTQGAWQWFDASAARIMGCGTSPR